ncbi:hypothetical protein Sru01_56640 [Sphaerisporangium rufum]|uniref:Uncharacterized protein n=1 Tax=Sphaerisporangium rufum TaxID=1381558 RepID=A0A919V3D1_9ACTN|nr:hypothetical protein [Sphaerisporangium rufum]GII80682.1 hypothetical protein Sru01_56640 [Sphaerisporangium rufum]
MREAAHISGWAVERFGERAASVRGRLAASLLEAAGNAQDAQQSSRSGKRYAYGSTLMARRYEALVDGFRDDPGFRVVRPHGSPHHLVVLDGNLLLPFRYAEDDTTPISDARVGPGRVSSLVRELFTRFGPRASFFQESLDLGVDEDAEDPDDTGGAGRPDPRVVLAQLPDDTRLIPVAYAANAQAGLLKLFWGEAELIDDTGHVHWVHCEQIPLSAALTGGSAAAPAVPPVPAARFDQGAVPDIGLVGRPAMARRVPALFPVHDETDEAQATGTDERA